MYLHDNSLKREVIHVPLIFWWPEHVPTGQLPQPVSLTSLLATIMDLIMKSDQAIFPGPVILGKGENDIEYQEWTFPIGEMQHKPWI